MLTPVWYGNLVHVPEIKLFKYVKREMKCVCDIYLHHLENSTSLADHHDTLRHFLFFLALILLVVKVRLI